jgi:hypothetical protein
VLENVSSLVLNIFFLLDTFTKEKEATFFKYFNTESKKIFENIENIMM